MVKRSLFIFFLLLVNIYLHSISDYRIVKVVLLKEFNYGSKDNEIGYFSTPYSEKGPSTEYYCNGLGFDFDNNIYFPDTANKRFYIIDKDLEFKQNIFFDNPYGIQLKFLTNNLIFIYNNNCGFAIVDIEKKELLARVYLSKKDNYKFSNTEDNFIYYDNTVFHWTNNGEIVSFVNPGLEGNKSFTPPEETRKNIKKKKYKGLKNDDQDRLFLNGKLLTRNYYQFITYWMEKHKNMIPPSNSIDFEYGSYKFTSGFTFCGEDNNGNTYWADSIFDYYIFNKDGWIIDKFLVEKSDFKGHRSSNFPPTIHKYGDIYLILRIHTENKYDFIMIPRTWGYDPKPGICAEDNVRVRVRPSIKADVVTSLKKDEKIEILDKTDEKMKIDNMENYWIKIKTKDGKYGWAYEEWIRER